MSDRLQALDAAREAEALRLQQGEAKLPVRPDWSASPLEVSCWTGASYKAIGKLMAIQVAWWDNDPNLKSFENTIYDFGFRPSGPGF